MVVNELWFLLLGVKKQKACNKTRGKYMSEERRQNLKQTGYQITIKRNG